MTPDNQFVVALDYGDKRVGVAIASAIARLPHPLTTLANDDNLLSNLAEIIQREDISVIVIGSARGLYNQTTEQTKKASIFIDKIRTRFKLPVYRQDEALTSWQAQAELGTRSKGYAKADVDSLAATYILEDWLNNRKR